MKPIVKQFHEQQIENIIKRKMTVVVKEEAPGAKKVIGLKKAGAKAGAKGADKKGKGKKKKKVEKPYEIQLFHVGDTVDVHYKIIEGEKERIQIFTGTVIRKKGSLLTESITVRRIVQGEGVERIFPMHSPKLMKIIVVRRGKVRRAKLYYLRDRVGKATKVTELLGTKADRLKSRDEKHQAVMDKKMAEIAAANQPEGEGGSEG